MYKTIGAVIIGAAVIVGSTGCAAMNQKVQTCTVNDKDRTTGTDGASVFRVYTDECGVLEVGDVWYEGNFNSADLYADIEPGHVYEFTTGGFRIGFFSAFPVIKESKQVK